MLKFNVFKNPTEEMKALLRRCANSNVAVASAARFELAVALTLPLKQGVLNGSNIHGIFEAQEFEPGVPTEYPLDFISPGTEGEYVAYTIPRTGRLPDFYVDADYLMVHTYDVGATIDTALKYIKHARWDVVGRMLQALEAMFVHKDNTDAWHVLIAAAKGRNLMPYDEAAAAGLFTRRVVNLARTIMQRNAGGNATSIGRGDLTDLFMSPEAHTDIFSWDLTQVDDVTRRQIYLSQNSDGLSQVGKVTLHEVLEFGIGQPYQAYYEDVQSGTFPTDKTELLIGLDLGNKDSFVHPIREKLEIFEDVSYHRSNRMSLYGRKESGWGVLDSRRAIALAI